MARVKKQSEEFNPWPPFVDVFSSVVLVLLLFILVLIVNVAYYMQFNTTINSDSKTKSQVDNLQAGIDVTNMITLQKVEKPKLDSGGNNSLFSGGKEASSSTTISKDKNLNKQNIQKISQSEWTIEYTSADMFLNKDIKDQIISFAKKAKNKGKKIEISAAYPINVISTTRKKRVTISRVVNVKNTLKKGGMKLSNIIINITDHEDQKYKYGYIKIKIK